jgi:hypothetical protein
MLKFPELEDRLNTQMQTNQMSARDKRQADSLLTKAKVGVWIVCMALWAIECRYRATCGAGSKGGNKVYGYRADKIE